MKSFEMEGCKCPTCQANLGGCTAVDGSDEGPTVGDITVCLYCGEILEFTEGLRVKLIEADTIPEIDLLQLCQAQKVVRAYREIKNNG